MFIPLYSTYIRQKPFSERQYKGNTSRKGINIGILQMSEF